MKIRASKPPFLQLGCGGIDPASRHVNPGIKTTIFAVRMAGYRSRQHIYIAASKQLFLQFGWRGIDPVSTPISRHPNRYFYSSDGEVQIPLAYLYSAVQTTIFKVRMPGYRSRKRTYIPASKLLFLQFGWRGIDPASIHISRHPKYYF